MVTARQGLHMLNWVQYSQVLNLCLWFSKHLACRMFRSLTFKSHLQILPSVHVWWFCFFAIVCSTNKRDSVWVEKVASSGPGEMQQRIWRLFAPVFSPSLGKDELQPQNRFWKEKLVLFSEAGLVGRGLVFFGSHSTYNSNISSFGRCRNFSVSRCLYCWWCLQHQITEKEEKLLQFGVGFVFSRY